MRLWLTRIVIDEQMLAFTRRSNEDFDAFDPCTAHLLTLLDDHACEHSRCCNTRLLMRGRCTSDLLMCATLASLHLVLDHCICAAARSSWHLQPVPASEALGI